MLVSSCWVGCLTRSPCCFSAEQATSSTPLAICAESLLGSARKAPARRTLCGNSSRTQICVRWMSICRTTDCRNRPSWWPRASSTSPAIWGRGILKKLILHRVLTHASRRALHVRVAHRKHRREEISHEGLVSHRSAVRSRGPRHHPGLRAGNTARCGVERRSSASCHVPACPCDGASGGAARVPARATGCPSRLLILFERRRRYSEIGEGLPSVARGLISAAGSIRPNGGRLLSSPIMETNAGLPTYRERPRGRRTAEQRDELAASDHSITSSARASTVGGISSPSALAVLRLMTSSYLVGACTGRSAGFSPLRMRST